MATIPRAALDYLSAQVNRISADACARVLAILARIEWTPDNIAQGRELVMQALRSVLPAYTSMAAQASADFYDSARMLSIGEAMGAEAISGYNPAAMDGAVRAFVQKIVDGKPKETFDNLVLSRVDYEMRRAANYCVVANGQRDPLKPKYARVPSGAETCSFCLMLASRGFVYRSAEAASHAHAGCDCRVVPGFPGMEVEGYDPDALLAEWRGRESFDIPEQKLTGYALNPKHPKGADKERAFREALGFTADDAGEIMRQVYRWVGEHDSAPSGNNGYGDIYSTEMKMAGKNGKTATVSVGWIMKPGDSKMKLTSIYVKRKRGGGNEG